MSVGHPIEFSNHSGLGPSPAAIPRSFQQFLYLHRPSFPYLSGVPFKSFFSQLQHQTFSACGPNTSTSVFRSSINTLLHQLIRPRYIRKTEENPGAPLKIWGSPNSSWIDHNVGVRRDREGNICNLHSCKNTLFVLSYGEVHLSASGRGYPVSRDLSSLVYTL